MNWDAGLRWAIGMLGLDTLELLVLLHVLFFDRKRELLFDGQMAGVEAYTLFILVSTGLQLLGILLVCRKWYRLGGALQIVSSVPHVVKLEGVVGVIGGLAAWNYPRTLGPERGPGEPLAVETGAGASQEPPR